ncbi:HAD domain-containing protein [Cupriavidus sp. CV2]|uniref:HAD domain-containing protein n=1 Tax=Cupriavidus ulmosensis TaxID=3065913 RepID=UPI00296AAD54|nr:HAD domain-containing protein [Cupriavidus sp. CV2]MDW3688515.1 HAD domain-containing protein [Cupriavidus sp. CV2]
MCVLYLDFDGVLHPEAVFRTSKGPWLQTPGHKLFENEGILEAALEPYPDVRIVLSTAWLLWRGGYSYAKRQLSPALQQRVIGATYHQRHIRRDEYVETARGVQIWQDVQRRCPDAWLALDDDGEHWPAWCREKLVLTHPVLGIAEPSVLAELERKLRAMCNGK